MKPITSLLLKNEPEFLDLVEVFVERLPPTIARIRWLYEQQLWPQLKKDVHELKGMGGGFGYPMLTELAAAIEAQVLDQDNETLLRSFDELDRLSARIVLGMEELEQKCA